MVGDGFGGRKWYSPTNYTVGSYAAYSVCYEQCEDSPNQLYGWGNNGYNELGLGSTIPWTNVPTPIPNMTNVKYYSTGYNMGAIKKDNTGWIWGNFTNTPIQVITDAYFLDASSNNISFVKTDGSVWTIGDNSTGQFGDGTYNNVGPTTPVKMLTINNAVRVANNYYTTIVLLNDSTLVSSGHNGLNGNLGLGQNVNIINTPTAITGIPKIIDIKSVAEATIALTHDGKVYHWGLNYPNLNISYTPTIVPNLNNIIAISGCDDGYHFLALDENKNCYAWGSNWGQMGLPITSNTEFPQIVATEVIDIMAGETFSYIVKSDGTLWASGFNNTGSIFLNLPINNSEAFVQLDPSQVPSACQIVGGGLTCEYINDSIYFPNVFTPNGDNYNDNFYLPNWGIDELKCDIYNRWGILVYQWNDINGFWNGKTMKGKDCADGVYYYIVYYKKQSSENWEKHTGFISLLR